MNTNLGQLNSQKPKLLRLTTLSGSLLYLIDGQLSFMRAKGFDVYGACADGDYWTELQSKEKIEKNVIPFAREIDLIQDLKSLYIAYKLIRKLKPDIVHSHTPKAGLIGMLASKLAGIGIRIHTVAGMPLMTMKGSKKQLLFLTERLTYAAASHVWPNSKSLYKYILDKKMLAKKKIDIVGEGSSNGVDTTFFNKDNIPHNLIEKAKKSLNYNKKYKYLLFVGRLVKDKGIEELVETFLKIRKKEKSIKLVLVGYYEEERDPLKPKIKHLIETEETIIATGFSDNVRSYLAICDYFIFPSYREGFPNVLLQAGAIGIPIICSKIVGNVDIVEDRKTGILFDLNTKNSFLEKLRYGIENPDLMLGNAKRLQSHIKNNFDRQKMHELIEKKYREILNQ